MQTNKPKGVAGEAQQYELTGVPTSTWYDLQNAGLAPKPIHLGLRPVGGSCRGSAGPWRKPPDILPHLPENSPSNFESSPHNSIDFPHNSSGLSPGLGSSCGMELEIGILGKNQDSSPSWCAFRSVEKESYDAGGCSGCDRR